MASLPEDDGPTMSGLPEDRRRVDLPPDSDGSDDDSDADDTTTAEAGPPASQALSGDRPDEGPAGHEAEDSTVQQKVSPPMPARRPPSAPVLTGPPPPVPSAMVGTLVSPVAPPLLTPSQGPSPSQAVISIAPSTQPSAMPSSPLSVPIPATSPSPVRPPSGSTTEADADPLKAAEELEADDLEEDEEDDDSVEDSVTTTSRRISAASLIEAAQASAISIKINDPDPEDMMDETEVRTRPGLVPLTIPASLRNLAPSGPAPSQPPPPVRPAAGRPPSMIAVSEVPATEDDDNEDDGVTTEAQAPRSGSIAELAAVMTLSAKSVVIEAAPGSPPVSAVASTDPSPGVDAVDGADELLTRPGVEGEEPLTRPGVIDGELDPPTRPGLEEPATRPGLGLAPEPETSKRVVPKGAFPNEDDDGESVTTRGPLPVYATGESVTSQSPPRGSRVASTPDLDDGTDGTTQKVKRTAAIKNAAQGGDSPADGESESITTQAPGPLTNILRVIASGSSPNLDDSGAIPLPLEDDEQPENRTAVMANAPLKRVIADLVAASGGAGSSSALPAIRPTGGPLLHGPQGSAAPQLTPSSESGLRARPGSGSGDHASLGALAADNRASGVVANAMASDGSVSAPIDIRALAATEMAFPSGQPSVHDVDLGKGPRYGLLVAIVAVISVIVPVTLYLALRRDADPPTPGDPAEAVSEVESPNPPRGKAARNRNGSYVIPTASPSASASARPHR